jgi:hypothetical protein
MLFSSRYNAFFCLLLLYNLSIFFVALRPKEGDGLHILKVSGSHKMTHHSRQDSSERVISPLQRPLPDNTQHSQQTSPVGFEPTISAGERPQTYALDRAATGIGTISPLQDYMYNLCSRPKIQH